VIICAARRQAASWLKAESEALMAKKSKAKKAKSRSGPRAPAGKRPLLVILDEQVVEDTKIAAVIDRRKVSAIVEELLKGWLASRKTSR
jgi:hypothetical protein